MEKMNLFEQASRLKLRWLSPRGELTSEQLWDLPLTSKNGFDLDSIAKTVNAELKACSEESFVATKKNPTEEMWALRLDILKHVIASKIADEQKRAVAAEVAAKRQKIMAALSAKQDQALEGKSIEELQAELAALG